MTPNETSSANQAADASPSSGGPDQPSPSAQSLHGLDGLNFLMADVRDGVGPYLSVFLRGAQHWAPGDIGLAMAASSLAAALCQIPAGLLVDALKVKRLLVAGSGVLVAAGCLLIVFFPHLPAVIAGQVMLGAASAVIPPALAALSLGLVGQRLLPARVSRNEGFNHGGNFAAAGLAGLLGQQFGYHWIFYLVCIFAVASAVVVTLIKPGEINHALARGGDGHPGQGKHAVPIGDLLKNRNLLVFLGSVVLFHLGNAAMLPMAGQVLAVKHPNADVEAMSACIIAAQLVMIGVAAAVGWAMKRGVGRKTIFLVGLAVLPVRGFLFTLTDSPVGVVSIQLLDGVAAGIFGVISIVIAADLMRGTGRFNLAQGLVALCTGAGAAGSNLLGGFVIGRFGYHAAFLSLAAIAVGALGFFVVLMPETRDLGQGGDRDGNQPEAMPSAA
ncbi:MAG TPA: MFS transporter [Chthoniobacterales bacterium]